MFLIFAEFFNLTDMTLMMMTITGIPILSNFHVLIFVVQLFCFFGLQLPTKIGGYIHHCYTAHTCIHYRQTLSLMLVYIFTSL